MQLDLQFGYGMMAHSIELVQVWRGGVVIMSPRDLTEDQLVSLGKRLRKAGAEPMIDPQCFLRDADRETHCAHTYFQSFQSHSSNSLINGSGASELLKQLAALSKAAKVKRFILPGLLAKKVDDLWFGFHERIIQESTKAFGNEMVLATISLSQEQMKNEKKFEEILERASKWKVSGFYVVVESPSGYLVDDPVWLANLLNFVAGLKLLKKYVILGYSNHQTIAAACCNIDSLASGTWMNVRAFPPEKFYEPDPEQQRRKAIWYYCPVALSEYKLQYLDIARKQGVLARMRPDPSLKSTYADVLFAGGDPSTVKWGEQNAFRHYLQCLHEQVRRARKSTFQETLDSYRASLDEAERLLKSLRGKGVFGQDREFTDCIDVNRSACLLLEQTRGSQLRRNW